MNTLIMFQDIFIYKLMMMVYFMKIELKGSTNGYRTREEFLKFGQDAARVCYSEKDWNDIRKEPPNPDLINTTIKSGHHSPYEHVWLNFYMDSMPKALVMVLNNERQYVTSEKSARYTQMKQISDEQKEKYEKWMGILIPLIDKIYPASDNKDVRDKSIKKLAQENARYMTSVFTPTKMLHTINLRQLNFFMYGFEKFIFENQDGNEFKRRLASGMKEFLEQTKDFVIPDLRNQTDRHLNFFGDPVEEHFGDVYSTNYLMSFAGLAQAHRHRTIEYHVSKEIDLGALNGFFIPGIISLDKKLMDEWHGDLEKISRNDFPQAQLLSVSEMGSLKDFRSKMILRLCGHAQYEIMENTLGTANEYSKRKPKIKDWMRPKCSQGMKCAEPCVWKSAMALERII